MKPELTDEMKAERVVAHVDRMRENADEMRLWKNIPLAIECLELLQSIDPAEESGIGQALACEAIVEKMPEYDVPRLTLKILRYERAQLALATDDELKAHPFMIEEAEQAIKRLEDYIDTEHLTAEAFREKYDRLLKADPIERTPEWEEHFYEVERECDRRLGDTPRGMGFCFSYWSTLRQVLAERGIAWRSPHELNPRVMFD